MSTPSLGELADRGRAPATAFIIALAVRASALVSELGSPRARDFVATLVEDLWRACAGSPFDAEGWERELRALPEASIDDSHDPRYYAMRALGLIVDAVHAVNEPRLGELLVSASEGALDLAGDIEYRLRNAVGVETRLEHGESMAQRENFLLLMNSPLTPRAMSSEHLHASLQQGVEPYASAARTLRLAVK